MAIKDISNPPETSSRKKQIKLKFLDGMRGLAALFVVLHHCQAKFATDHPPAWSGILLYGKFAVDIFIVLSGFLLMLPVATSLSRTLEGGIGPYIQRRALRILPPYYAAFAYSCLLLGVGSFFSGKIGATRTSVADLNLGSVLSHLFLVHNLIPAWSDKINSPLWSVATEWQIYFIFPLLLIPTWRKVGLWGTFAVAILLGIVPQLIGLRWAASSESWLLVLFTMGLAGAVFFARMVDRADDLQELQKQSKMWGIAGLVISLGIVAALVIQPVLYFTFRWLVDCFVGIATVCLLLFSAPPAHLSALSKPWLLRIMESKFALWVGMFSYSLYLTHGPLLAVVAMIVKKKLHLGVSGNLIVVLLIGPPISLAFGYLFYLIAERPFLRKKQGVTSLPAAELSLSPGIRGGTI